MRMNNYQEQVIKNKCTNQLQLLVEKLVTEGINAKVVKRRAK